MRDIREEYQAEQLHKRDLLADPLAQATRWLEQAVAAQLPLPNSMVLATADGTGRPSCRTVLLKGIEQGGFVFFSHYDSRKGADIAANPQVAATLMWEPFARQICFTGTAERLTVAASQDYFASRPRGSQLSAAVSPQSQVVPSRDWLVAQRDALIEQLGDAEVPMPANWGGYRVLPEEMQFWHGRPDRLHDRFRYARQSDGSWLLQRLAP